MRTVTPTPAAQYLRMSTEHQQYSIANQAAAIQDYANAHGFVIVRSYADAGRSGLVLKNRTGLQELLRDAVSGEVNYKAILVYDVSRWGRFQDSDEAAHYEFLCKSAGIPVFYCAEPFTNDGTLPSSILKVLKRTMAAEYSRELGVKCYEGLRRLAQLGYRVGATCGYGFRRMIIDKQGKPRQLLAAGEYKNLSTDRVILVPGPGEQIAVIREMYRMVAEDKRTPAWIMRWLNRKGIKRNGSKWSYDAVHQILTNPKYMGCNVWGRTCQKLHRPTIHVPREQWTVRTAAFEPIIGESTFVAVQQALADRTANKSNAEILERVKALLAVKGRLSEDVIEQCRDLPAVSTFQHRFGGLRRVYELIGYYRSPEYYFPRVDLRKRTQGLRDQVVEQLASSFREQITVVRHNVLSRPQIRLKDGKMVSVLACRTVRTPRGHLRWKVEPIHQERRYTTVLCRLNQDNTGFHDFYLLPGINRSLPFRLKEKDQWLKQGKRLHSLSEFGDAVRELGLTQRG